MRRVASRPPELDGFRFTRLLGSGGFSDVFQYEQELPERSVAVKVLLADGVDEVARARFVEEANLMARLSAHPSIVTIFHAGVATDGRPYLVMEYCSGPSLARPTLQHRGAGCHAVLQAKAEHHVWRYSSKSAPFCRR